MGKTGIGRPYLEGGGGVAVYVEIPPRVLMSHDP